MVGSVGEEGGRRTKGTMEPADVNWMVLMREVRRVGLRGQCSYDIGGSVSAIAG